MPQALISINGVAGANDDLPINTSVTLSNVNIGGETTYSWVILAQPTGTACTLSATNVQSPTFTPTKEGTYRIQVTVNGSLTNIVIAGVRQLTTRGRVPAATETFDDGATGWFPALEKALQLVDATRADPDIFVGQADASGVAVGSVVYISSFATLKAGLPFPYTCPVVSVALGTSAANIAWSLGVVTASVSGGAIANGSLVYVRTRGFILGTAGTATATGQSVYVSDTGTLVNNTPGTNTRKIGVVVVSHSGTSFDAYIDTCASALESPYPDAVTWSATQAFANGITIATTKAVAGAQELNIAATGAHQVICTAGGTEVWRAWASGGIGVGHVVDPAAVGVCVKYQGGFASLDSDGTTVRAIAVITGPSAVQFGGTALAVTATGTSVSLTTTAGDTSAAGGTLSGTAGNGGASVGMSAGGAGGGISWTGGVGGAGSGVKDPGVGGGLQIVGGAAGSGGSGNANGGSHLIIGGAASGSGTPGSVNVNTQAPGGAVNLARSGQVTTVNGPLTLVQGPLVLPITVPGAGAYGVLSTDVVINGPSQSGPVTYTISAGSRQTLWISAADGATHTMTIAITGGTVNGLSTITTNFGRRMVVCDGTNAIAS